MSLHIIELNDRDIRLSSADTILESSPGIINIANNPAIFGEPAHQQTRLHPRQSFNQFWSKLSLDPLANGNEHFRHQADLAYAHLNDLSARHNINGDVIFAVPSNYSRDQLAILLGLVKQSSFTAVGLVDLAVLHSFKMPSVEPSIFVDIQLHQTVLTTLNNTNGLITRGKVLQIPGTGLLALYDAWSNMISDEFITQSRFDPQHNAGTEQYVYSHLKPWLTDAIEHNEVLMEINNKGSIHQAKINLDHFEQRARNIVERIQNEVNNLSTTETSLYLPEEISELPGITLYLEQVISLPKSAPAANCFTASKFIVRDADKLGLVTSLPLDTLGHSPSNTPSPLQNATNGEQAKPLLNASHILLNHQAYCLPMEQVQIGPAAFKPTSDNNGFLYITIDDSALSSPLTIIRQGDNLILQNNSTLGVQLNHQTLTQDTRLQLGDSISFATATTTLQLIQVQ